ncbi:hypothetical protein [Sinorhizobium medicae]|uniref:hypothetical protein n=1 Tax=Sinorhizobium medicae TaxID=110321 RepID=UPI000FD6D892|nr:hypothetical protein [Sinorhizobium medicae]RVJ23437.1 hypothetical protein CN179_24780 [Sinorhizobium medicae]
MVTKPYGQMTDDEFEAELQSGWSPDAQKLMRAEREDDRRKAAAPPAPAKVGVSTAEMNKFVRFVGQRFAEERDELREELRLIRKASQDHRDALERAVDEKVRSRMVRLERGLETALKDIEALRQEVEERKLRAIR